jgi:hypothetical protein
MRAAGPSRTRSAVQAVRLVLPVSGVAVALRQPTGAEDLRLTEHDVGSPDLPLVLIERLGMAETELAWADLPVADIDAMIVRLRRALLGDRVVADVACAAAECGQRIDLSFSLDGYLAHHQPRPAPRSRGWRVEAVQAPWHALVGPGGEAARFRLPTLADQLAVAAAVDPAVALLEACVRPAGLPARVLARVEAAMAAMAPPLSGALEGRCPECGTPISAWFDARRYCLQELADRARFVFDDVDVLADRYHWSERAILTLPHSRRTEYADRARRVPA